MAEAYPTFIPCAASNNAFTEVLVRRKGDLVEIVGHPVVDLAPDDAEKLADTVRDIVFRIRARSPYGGFEE